MACPDFSSTGLRRTDAFPKGERGAAMLAALCLAMVFAICLSSYMALCFTSLKMSTRNMASAQALGLAENGLDFALYSLNNTTLSSGGWDIVAPNASAPMTMTSTGFLRTDSSPTPLDLGNGLVGTVTVVISNYLSSTPTITSTATVTIPNQGNVITRKITTSAAISPVFVNALAATSSTVRFRSAGTVDSYDSRLGTYAAQNPAATPGLLGSSAVILSQDTSASRTVRLNNATLHGYAVGYDSNVPTTTSWFTPITGSTKVLGPSTPVGTNVDMTRVISNPIPYQPLSGESLPSGAYLSLPASACSTPISGILSRTWATPTLPVTTTVYYANGINLTNATVTIHVPTVIVLYGSLNISGTGGIVLNGLNASLTIFAENGAVTIGGNGITNTTAIPYPKRVAILSTNNATWAYPFNTVTLSTAVPFYGVIYFPYLPISVTSPNGSAIYGSIVGQSISFTNSPTIHYDVALRVPDTLAGDSAFLYPPSPVAAGALAMSVGP
jgi:hypothetical protein